MTTHKSTLKAGLGRKEVEVVLEAFLDPKNEAKVFALKGDWGVGKTHLVRTYLSREKKEYYYASVFGISSIDELKIQLWSNFQSATKEEKIGFLGTQKPRKNLTHIKEISESIEKATKSIPNIGVIGGIVTSSTISLISNLIINNILKGKLVCIDDLERASKKLRLDELLGFVETLSEEYKCKIILIYHEDKLDEDKDAQKILKDYREKVIDIEVKLTPSTNENFHIGFGKDDPDEKVIFDYLNSDSIQTNNIRALNKLRWVLGELRPHIKDFLPIIQHQIQPFPLLLSTITAFGKPVLQEARVNQLDDNFYDFTSCFHGLCSKFTNQAFKL